MKKKQPKPKDPVRVKSGRKSRRKGKRGEYESRDLLTKLFYPDKDGKVERTPMSGAWHGTPVMTGDLVFLKNDNFDGRFPFHFEVKNVSKTTIAPYRLLQGNAGVLWTWLNETAEKADKGWPTKALPILMWKVNFSDWFIMFTHEVMERFIRFGSGFPVFPKDYPHMRTREFYLMPFGSFAEWVKPWVRSLKV
jgi:hypothetical protein